MRFDRYHPIPQISRIAILCAALTNLIHGDGFQVLRPLIFMVFLTVVLYLRRPWASSPSTRWNIGMLPT